jgi:acetyl esterase/lipase
MAELYFVLSVAGLLSVLAAIIQARRLRWLAPLYFLAAWLCGELAYWHLLWQVALTGLLAATGVFDESLAQWGLCLYSLSWLGLAYLHGQAMDSQQPLSAALEAGLGANYRDSLAPERRALLVDQISTGSWLRPFHFRREGVRLHANIGYGNAGKRNLLDIYQPESPREGGFPVLLQVHGGAWMIGEKEQQAKPLMYHMAQRGWICVAVNYRLSPSAAFPAHIIDVKKAIAWIRDNIASYGGDPHFIAITGGSAGGHLSSLAALTPNKTEWQPGFEQVDTTLQAAVPFYGVYDFLDRNNIRGVMSMEDMLARRVMQVSRQAEPELWDDASPIHHVGTGAPPMFVLHGTHDSLVFVEEARAFVSELTAVAAEPVAYAELPGAQHAFEVFHSVRTDHMVNAVAAFLEWSHARHQAGQRGED